MKAFTKGENKPNIPANTLPNELLQMDLAKIREYMYIYI